MKKFLFAAIIAASVSFTAKADLTGAVTGIAMDVLKNTLISSLGKTTVTPYYRLYRWDYYHSVDDPAGGRSYTDREYAQYKPILDVYVQNTVIIPTNPSGPVYSNNVALSIPDNPTTQHFSCDVPITWVGTNLWYHEILNQDFSLSVWVTTVKSGLNPPDEPYSVTLKANSTKVAENCLVDPFAGNWPVRNTYKAGTSATVVTFGSFFDNYSYAWPFDCWAGDTYAF